MSICVLLEIDLRVFMLSVVFYVFILGRNSSVGIGTRYGVDDLGIESRWRRDFIHQFKPALGPTQHRASFPVVKRPGVALTSLPQSSVEVKESVDLYLHSSGPSWCVLG